MRYYYGGAPLKPGTSLPNNVTGECHHRHRTPGGAQRCINRLDRAMKRGNGPDAYCDRVVMVAEAVRHGRSKWLRVSGSVQVWQASGC